jgi:hypothetical protein
MEKKDNLLIFLFIKRSTSSSNNSHIDKIRYDNLITKESYFIEMLIYHL